MNCIIKSWRCSKTGKEVFINQPPKKDCEGEWVCYEWRRKLKPIK
jgi:hypothetical protein